MYYDKTELQTKTTGSSIYIYIYTAKCEGRIPFPPIKC